MSGMGSMGSMRVDASGSIGSIARDVALRRHSHQRTNITHLVSLVADGAGIPLDARRRATLDRPGVLLPQHTAPQGLPGHPSRGRSRRGRWHSLALLRHTRAPGRIMDVTAQERESPVVIRHSLRWISTSTEIATEFRDFEIPETQPLLRSSCFASGITNVRTAFFSYVCMPVGNFVLCSVTDRFFPFEG